MRQPVRFCSSLMVDPPLPMTKPTYSEIAKDRVERDTNTNIESVVTQEVNAG